MSLAADRPQDCGVGVLRVSMCCFLLLLCSCEFLQRFPQTYKLPSLHFSFRSHLPPVFLKYASLFTGSASQLTPSSLWNTNESLDSLYQVLLSELNIGAKRVCYLTYLCYLYLFNPWNVLEHVISQLSYRKCVTYVTFCIFWAYTPQPVVTWYFSNLDVFILTYKIIVWLLIKPFSGYIILE